MAWKGEFTNRDASTQVKGTVSIPLMSDDDENNEFEINIVLDDGHESEEAEELRLRMVKDGVPRIKKLIVDKFIVKFRSGEYMESLTNADVKSLASVKDLPKAIIEEPKSAVVESNRHAKSTLDKYEIVKVINQSAYSKYVVIIEWIDTLLELNLQKIRRQSS